MNAPTALAIVKAVHTLVWAFFVACIVLAPIATALGHHGWGAALSGLVTLEALVLVVNRWRCPLTDVAGRYTDERQENFDIFLPRWLARHNKILFTPPCLLGALYTLTSWWQHR